MTKLIYRTIKLRKKSLFEKDFHGFPAFLSTFSVTLEFFARSAVLFIDANAYFWALNYKMQIMIQRKQSFYLLIAAAAVAIFTMFDLMEFINVEASYVLKYSGIFAASPAAKVFTTYPLVILVFASLLLTITTVFIFKNRSLQLRFCGINIALLIGIIVFSFYFGHVGKKSLEAIVVYKWTLALPLWAIVMQILAFLAIAKDEALVRSINRIR